MNNDSLRPYLVLFLALAATAPAAAQSLYQRQSPQPAQGDVPTQPPPAAAFPTPQPAEAGHPAADAPHPPSHAPGAPASQNQPSQPSQPGQPVMLAAPQSAVMSVRQVSLFAVIPPKPHSYQKHDKIEVIINESSLSTSQQKTDTEKKYDFLAELSQFPSLNQLIYQAELVNGMVNPASVGINSDVKFNGSGQYQRKDQFTARMSALVSDVKPNGLMLIEARETIQSDEEIKTLVISGVCDPKDVTQSNTVQSAQLANLVIRVEHTGQVKDAATKGIIPRVLEGLFNF